MSTLRDLRNDNGFKRFQNEVSESVYDELKAGYLAGEGEVRLVTRMAQAMNAKSYKGVSLYSEKIHGGKSYVDFQCKGDKTKKELGDMVLISVVTQNRERVLQRVSIVQNKLFKNGTAQVDKGQLFLLKNFPTFKSTTGMFKGLKGSFDFIDRNSALGSYGLFQAPGEMIYASAFIVADVKGDASSIRVTDLNRVELNTTPLRNDYLEIFPDEYLHPLVLRYCHFCRDVSSLIRNLTQFYIGEFSIINSNIVDKELDDLAVSILKRVGISGIDLSGTDMTNFVSEDSDGDNVVIVAHLELEKE